MNQLWTVVLCIAMAGCSSGTNGDGTGSENGSGDAADIAVDVDGTNDVEQLPGDLGDGSDVAEEDSGTTTGDELDASTDQGGRPEDGSAEVEDTPAEVEAPKDIPPVEEVDTKQVEPEEASKKYEVLEGCAIPLDYETPECALALCPDGLMCVGAGYCVKATPFKLGNAAGMTYSKPAISDAKNGRFAASWYHVYKDLQGTKQMDIYFQIYNADGTPTIDAVKLDDDTLIYARSPSMVRMGDGGFLVIWRAQAAIGSGEIRYMARVVDPNGEPQDKAFQLNQTELISKSPIGTNVDSPFAKRLRNSNLAVSWMGQPADANNTNVYLRLLNPDGSFLTDELPTGADTSEHEGSSVITDTFNGGLAIFWTAVNNPPKGEKGDPQPKKSAVVKGRIFDQFAAPKGDVFQVTDNQWNYEGMPAAATFEKGDIYVSWKTRETVGATTKTAIWGVRLGPSGEKVGAQQLKAGLDPLGYYPFYAPVGIGDNERAFVVWHTIDPTTDGIYMRRYYIAEDVMDCDITEVSQEMMENENGNRIMPSIQAFEDGRTLIAWSTIIGGVKRMMVRYLK
jgi:hypothetical protein